MVAVMRTLDIYEDGEVIVHGVNYESKVYVHDIQGKRLILKWKGGTHWARLGERGRHATTLMVWDIHKITIAGKIPVFIVEATQVMDQIPIRSTPFEAIRGKFHVLRDRLNKEVKDDDNQS